MMFPGTMWRVAMPDYPTPEYLHNFVDNENWINAWYEGRNILSIHDRSAQIKIFHQHGFLSLK